MQIVKTGDTPMVRVAPGVLVGPALAADRDALLAHLDERGIDASQLRRFSAAAWRTCIERQLQEIAGIGYTDGTASIH